MTAIMPKDEAQKLLDEVSDSRHWVKSGRALKEMQNAAPNLAHSLIAAHDEIERLRADAQAAVVLVVERFRHDLQFMVDSIAEDKAYVAEKYPALFKTIQDRRAEMGTLGGVQVFGEIARDLLALATPDGLALVAELRATNARLAAQVQALTGAMKTARECFKGVLGAETDDMERRDQGLDLIDAALEAAEIATMTPAERADFDLTMRIRGAAGDIVKKQIAAREGK